MAGSGEQRAMSEHGGLIPAAVIDTLGAAGTTRHYPAGSLVFAEGDPPGPLFVLRSGEVRITTSAGNHSLMRGPNAIFGELAALAGTPRTGSATAVTDVVVSAIGQGTLARLLETHPDVAERVRAVAGSRVLGRDWNGGLTEHGCPIDELAGWILRQESHTWSLGDIARTLGVSHELVSRSIDHLVARGALMLERGTVLVRSTDLLTTIADGSD